MKRFLKLLLLASFGSTTLGCGDAPGPGALPGEFRVATRLESRTDLAASALDDGRIVIAGGARLDGTLVSAGEVVNVRTGQVQRPRCSLRYPRRRARAVTLRDGRIMILGGDRGGAGIIRQTEIYDPATDCFAAGPMLQAHDFEDVDAVVRLQDGRVLAIEGIAGDVQIGGGAELIDAVANRTERIDINLGVARDRGVPALLPDGRVLVTGGMIVTTGGILVMSDAALIFDPSTNRFRLLPDRLTFPRADHAVAVLPSGRVLIVGGAGDKAARSAELFDPGTERFTPVPGSLGTPRVGATASVLSDGRVLIVGGKPQYAQPPLASTEWFDEPSGRFQPGPSTRRGMGFGHVAIGLASGALAVVRAAGDPPTDEATELELYLP